MSKIVVMATALIVSAFLTVDSMAIGGPSASGHGAVRSFSSEWVPAGGEFTVTITAWGYGPFGQVVETLPDGFRLVGAGLSDAGVGATGPPMKFTLFGEEEFTYTATAPDTEGAYEFTGILLDSHRYRETIGGSISLNVGAPPPSTFEPTPTPALTPTPAPTATATATATPVPEPSPTSAPTPTPMREPTATPTPEATFTPVPASIATPARTSTATPTATSTPTPTPASTSTPEPTPSSTSTATPEPTAILTAGPTAVPGPAESSTESKEDEPPIPMWLFFVLAVGALAIVAGIAVLVVDQRQRRWPWPIFPLRRRAPTPLLDPEEES